MNQYTDTDVEIMKTPEQNDIDTKRLFQLEDSIAETAERISTEVFRHPELGDSEFYCSAFLADEAEKAGFEVTRGYLGLPTAFRADFGNAGGPTVAFLAEYDALPGYGSDGTENGHACGHNWIAASTFAAAAALKALKEETGFQGRISWIGCPAEENNNRKITLIEKGAFKDVDAALQMHLGRETTVHTSALACAVLHYDFEGRAAHASAAPENGINALDAVMLTFSGINCLRQHVTSDVRIHGVVRDGGHAPNVVPDHGSMEVYIRAGKLDYLEEVIEKVANCARGAALMTGAKLTITRDETTTCDVRNDPVIAGILAEQLEALGENLTVPSRSSTGSTDIGNVTYEVPTAYANMGVSEYSDAGTHDAAFLDVADSPFAHGKLHIAAKAMAATALRIFLDPDLQAQILRR